MVSKRILQYTDNSIEESKLADQEAKIEVANTVTNTKPKITLEEEVAPIVIIISYV